MQRTRKVMSLIVIISLLLPSALVFGQDAPAVKRDFYVEGQVAAQRDYSGGGAMVGGLASGFLLGLIGWGIGYLVVANQDGSVPPQHVLNLEPSERILFEQGYKDYVKKARKGKFNVGAGIGTLGAVLLVLSSSS